MHIKNLTINLQQPTVATPELAKLLKSLEDSASAPSAPIATSHLTPPNAGEIWPGQGGHYICTLPASLGLPARHLILSTTEHEDIKWGEYDHDVTGATSQVDGRANTAALIADKHQHPAAIRSAEHNSDGHTDFHLPSRHDLYICFLHAPQLFRKDDWYWSSSQSSRDDAWAQDFEYGDSSHISKGIKCLVRAVRWIQL